jgi:hypothetical protein
MYCNCGLIWNKSCSFASLSNVNAYQSKWSFEEMMTPGHESGFYEMTPDQRRKYTTNNQGMIKSSCVHGLRVSVSSPFSMYEQPPPPLLSSAPHQPSAPQQF